jgi:hypothetical protein
MRRVIVIAFTGIGLAGCSSFSLDSFKPTPPLVQVQLESTPPGADATTSIGPGCKTPCSVSVAAPDAGFAVTFALPRFQPVTVPVQVIRNPGDFTSPGHHRHRAEPGICRAEARRAAAEGAQAEAEEAEACRRRTGRRRLAVPCPYRRTGNALTGFPDRPIHRTAPKRADRCRLVVASLQRA